MKRRSYTVVEALITVVILAVLSAAGIVTWGNMVEKANRRVCEQNEIMLRDALRFYIADNDEAPISLSQLMPKYTDFAIARLKENEPHTYLMRKIYLALININESKMAWAKPPFKKYVGINTRILICPTKTGAGLSYGFNHKLKYPRGRKTAMEEFKELESTNMPIICDSDHAVFYTNVRGDIFGAAFRHGRRRFFSRKATAVAIGGKGTVRIISRRKNWSDPEEETRSGKRKDKKKKEEEEEEESEERYITRHKKYRTRTPQN